MTTFVGLGFGAIQAGLFLYEAQQSGAFARLVVAEVLPARVRALRANGGCYTVNIAHADRVETVRVGPVDVYNPLEPDDREALIAAVADASEAATALPSVEFYRGEAIAGVFAAGLARKATNHGPPLTVYCAENHNQAAQLLRRAVTADERRQGPYGQVRFLDTVIGKMSGIVPADGTLAPMMPGLPDAFLVEAFNRILVGGAELTGGAQLTGGAIDDSEYDDETKTDAAPRAAFTRKLTVFDTRPDLRPFEEAKLYCHNAGHAVAGYLGRQKELTRMDQVADAPEILALTRQAMVAEAGAALAANHAGTDPLFTPAGMAAYADDLLHRMVNPYLRDEIARVTRDPARKLGWNDRLVGAMRVALANGIAPEALAQGTLAAFRAWASESGYENAAVEEMTTLWPASTPEEEREAVLAALRHAEKFAI